MNKSYFLGGLNDFNFRYLDIVRHLWRKVQTCRVRESVFCSYMLDSKLGDVIETNEEFTGLDDTLDEILSQSLDMCCSYGKIWIKLWSVR